MNDIVETVPSNHISVYADDTTVLNYETSNKELENGTFNLLNWTFQYFNKFDLT